MTVVKKVALVDGLDREPEPRVSELREDRLDLALGRGSERESPERALACGLLGDRRENRVAHDQRSKNSVTAATVASISSDGRFVTFESVATDLVTGDSNGVDDVFVFDRQNNTTARVSVDKNGTEANGASTRCVISADGRYVAFRSASDNLVPVDGEIYTETLAELYADQGATDKAIEVYQKLIANDPDNEALTRRLTELETLEPGSDRQTVPIESLAPDGTAG